MQNPSKNHLHVYKSGSDGNKTMYKELYHHGILGQRWGKRNGPPYPLGASDHSQHEKKAGWRKSLSKTKPQTTKRTHKERRGLSDSQKTAIKVGVGLIATALVAYGGYKLYKSGALNPLIKRGTNRMQEEPVKKIMANTVYQSVSNVSDSNQYFNSGRAIYAFNPDIPWDKKVYEGSFAGDFKQWKGSSDAFEHTFRLVKDAKFGDLDDQVSVFKDLYNNDTSFRSDTISTLKQSIANIKRSTDSGFFRTPQYKVDIAKSFEKFDFNNDKLTDEQFKALYRLYGNDAFYGLGPESKKFISKLSSKFDVVIDPNNFEVYNNAKQPLVFFNPREVLEIANESRKLGAEEILDNTKFITERLKELGIKSVT